MFRRRLVLLCAVFYTVLAVLSADAQTLNLPPRPTNAPTASQWTNIVWQLSRDERENWIYAQVISGNVPNWQRTLKPISVSAGGHTATYYVTPDYLAIGSDTDYFLEPTTPLLAQRLVDQIGCTLPTRKMVNQIWTNATVKMDPQPIPPSAEMITVPVFASNNVMVVAQRNTFTNAHPLGALVSGDKKDVIISGLIYTNFANGPSITKPVVIYGWHYTTGVPIQPAYNGHEETYADYSHGIRFVQMNCTVDGAANTVTNVLASSTLAVLFSDETLSPNNTIPVPRYTVAALAPTVMTHPGNRSALPGTNVTFSSLAIGDAPLNYRWLFNGVSIPGATNSFLNLTNIQSANAGNYSIVVTNFSGTVTSRVGVLRVKTTDFPVLFTDNFDTNSAGNWNIFSGQSSGPPDYTVDFAFDYGATPYTFNGVTALIPPAPNSADGSTRGVRLTANNNDATAATAAVNLYPKNFSVSNKFALKFDLWINYPGGAGGINATGSTQFAQFGINHAGTNVNWAAPSASASDGVWFAVDGEGGTSADYRAYVGNPGGTQIDLSGSPGASGLVATGNVASVFINLFPSTRFETAGSPGKNWVEVEIRQTNNFILWLMDGTVIAQRTNASSFTGGNLMLGLMDPFSSIANPARDCFVIFDNVRVENLAPPITFQNIARQANGNISLTVNSALGDAFTLESSTNLFAWQPVASLLMTNNPQNFLDATAPGQAALFYRARR
jgi:hypothetical protein